MKDSNKSIANLANEAVEIIVQALDYSNRNTAAEYAINLIQRREGITFSQAWLDYINRQVDVQQ